MSYRDYPSKIPLDPLEREKFLRKVGVEYLLSLWQWFEVYHLAPYTTPDFALPKEKYMKKNQDEGDSGEGGITGDGFVTREIKKLFRIYDFGDYLATSSGEEVGLRSNGKLLRTVDKMIDILIARGAKEIAFGKRCFEPAKLYAWQQATLNGIKVHDFRPDSKVVATLDHTYGFRLQKALEETLTPDIIMPE